MAEAFWKLYERAKKDRVLEHLSFLQSDLYLWILTCTRREGEYAANTPNGGLEPAGPTDPHEVMR